MATARLLPALEPPPPRNRWWDGSQAQAGSTRWPIIGSFRAEYLYAGFSKVNAVGAITDAGGGANTLHGSSDLTIQAIRAGVNYKF